MLENSLERSGRKLRVFLCHVSEDKPIVRDIYRKLQMCNVEPWLDEQNLALGQRWELLIPDVIRKCDIVLICLSHTFLIKESYGNYEIHVVLEAAKRKSPNSIYHIPFKLDDCEVPNYLEGIHYGSNLVPTDFDKLLAACEKRREWLNETQGENIEPLRKFSEHNHSIYTDVSIDVAHFKGTGSSDPVNGPLPEVWNVTRRHTAFFTGRAHVLQQLADNFRVKNGVEIAPPQAITGLAGMGKTQTAAEYAYRFRTNYRFVLWVRAQTRENLIMDFRTIARLLKLPKEDVADEDILLQTMQEWLKKEKGWLLIFDNVDDLPLVEPFVPRIGIGHVLLTTRTSASTPLAQPVELQSLSKEDGALCLLRRGAMVKWNERLEDALPERAQAALALTQLMKGLPLALEQAGAYIDDTKCGVITYLSRYREYRKDLQQIHSGGVLDYAKPVAPALMMSSLMIGRQSIGFELLQLCAFLAPDGIPDQFIIQHAQSFGPILGAIAGNPIAFDQAIRTLVIYSLLEREESSVIGSTTLSIHRILQLVLLDQMDEPTRVVWLKRIVHVLVAAKETALWSLLQTHVQYCLDHIVHWHLSIPEATQLSSKKKI